MRDGISASPPCIKWRAHLSSVFKEYNRCGFCEELNCGQPNRCRQRSPCHSQPLPSQWPRARRPSLACWSRLPCLPHRTCSTSAWKARMSDSRPLLIQRLPCLTSASEGREQSLPPVWVVLQRWPNLPPPSTRPGATETALGTIESKQCAPQRFLHHPKMENFDPHFDGI